MGSVRRRRGRVVEFAVVLLAVAGMLSSSISGTANAQAPRSTSDWVRVVSSAPDQVSGGDARIEITSAAVSNGGLRLKVEVNGEDQTDRFTRKDRRTMSGVVDGLVEGANEVVVSETPRGRGRAHGLRSQALTLVNHPVTGPIFSGDHQKAFVCTTQDHGLGQPVPDSATGWPVRDGSGAVVGRSEGCYVEPKVEYRYRTTADAWAAYTPGQERPADIATTTTIDGDEVDYIVRWERGSINRFIYSIAALDPEPSSDHSPNPESWNGRAVYYFQGGVAIGHTQGSPSGRRMLYDDALRLGYAVIYSTGTKTGTHYDLELGAETGLMTKERFIEQYGTPDYTVGVGGSGGGIQQYVYGQNLGDRLIDAAIPQYSYPDMVTQTIHIGDCELLEFYMDAIDPAAWSTWSDRSQLIGLNASDTIPNPYTGGQPGSDECVRSWRGLSPLTLNPHYGYEPGIETITPLADVASIQWTHWEDAVNIYGRGEDGFARSTWDNVGVQYGLQALLDGDITPDEFLRLNGSVGGWKEQADTVQESCPFFPTPGCPPTGDPTDPAHWDPWSVKNQVVSDGVTPAPRTEGSIEAMNAAYEKGHVFVGDIDIPIIDWRHYLERELDMHNTHQSFASRQRMRNFDGDSSNQVIWFTDAQSGIPEFDQTPEALAVIDEWMSNIEHRPSLGVAGNRPAAATDRCFDASGNEIAAGADVWDGILDDEPDGACTQQFPIYSTSRIVAGGPIEGGVFKCALQSVDDALAAGLYGSWTPSGTELATLQAIFPDGVCDYTRPDVGRPSS